MASDSAIANKHLAKADQSGINNIVRADMKWRQSGTEPPEAFISQRATNPNFSCNKMLWRSQTIPPTSFRTVAKTPPASSSSKRMRHPGPLFLTPTRAYSLTQTLVRLARQSYQEYKVCSLQKRSRRKQMVGTANSYPKDLMARTILRRRQAAKSSKSPLNEKASSFELAYR